MDAQALRLNTSVLLRNADHIVPVLQNLHDPGFVLSHSGVPVRLIQARRPTSPRNAIDTASGSATDNSTVVIDTTRVVGDEVDNGNPWYDPKRMPEQRASMLLREKLLRIGRLPWPKIDENVPNLMSVRCFPAIDALAKRIYFDNPPISPYPALANRRAAILKDFLPLLRYHMRHSMMPDVVAAVAASSNAGNASGARPVFVSRHGSSVAKSRLPASVWSLCDFMDIEPHRRVLSRISDAVEALASLVTLQKFDEAFEKATTCFRMMLPSENHQPLPLLSLFRLSQYMNATRNPYALMGSPAVELSAQGSWFSDPSKTESWWKCELYPPCAVHKVLVCPIPGHRAAEYTIEFLGKNEAGESIITSSMTIADDASPFILAVNNTSSIASCGLRVGMRRWSHWNTNVPSSFPDHNRCYGLQAVIPITEDSAINSGAEGLLQLYSSTLDNARRVLRTINETDVPPSERHRCFQRSAAVFLRLAAVSGSATAVVQLAEEILGNEWIHSLDCTDSVLQAMVKCIASADFSVPDVIEERPCRSPIWRKDVQFEASLSSSVTCNRYSATSASKHAFAVLPVACEPTSGTYRWSLRLAEDRYGQECVCFGLIGLPASEPCAYDTCPDAFVLRAYNGKLYLGGRLLTHTRCSKVHPGSVVTVWFDSDSSTLGISINGAWQGCFPIERTSNKILYPAVMFYGVGKRVELVGSVDNFAGSLLSSACSSSEKLAVTVSGQKQFPVMSVDFTDSFPCLRVGGSRMQNSGESIQPAIDANAAWECTVCTLVNQSNAECSVCGTARPIELTASREAHWACTFCTFLNEPQTELCLVCHGARATGAALLEDRPREPLVEDFLWPMDSCSVLTLVKELFDMICRMHEAAISAANQETYERKRCCDGSGVAAPNAWANHNCEVQQQGVLLGPITAMPSSVAADAWKAPSALPFAIQPTAGYFATLSSCAAVQMKSAKNAAMSTSCLTAFENGLLYLLRAHSTLNFDIEMGTNFGNGGWSEIIDLTEWPVARHLFSTMTHLAFDAPGNPDSAAKAAAIAGLLLNIVSFTPGEFLKAATACLDHITAQLADRSPEQCDNFGHFVHHLLVPLTGNYSLREHHSLWPMMLHTSFWESLRDVAVALLPNTSLSSNSTSAAISNILEVGWLCAMANAAADDSLSRFSNVINGILDILEFLKTPQDLLPYARSLLKCFSLVQTYCTKLNENNSLIAYRCLRLLHTLSHANQSIERSVICKDAGPTDADSVLLRLRGVVDTFCPGGYPSHLHSTFLKEVCSTLALTSAAFVVDLVTCAALPVSPAEEHLQMWLNHGILQLPLMSDGEFGAPDALEIASEAWAPYAAAVAANGTLASQLKRTRQAYMLGRHDSVSSIRALFLSTEVEPSSAPLSDDITSLVRLLAAGSPTSDTPVGAIGSQLMDYLQSHSQINALQRRPVSPPVTMVEYLALVAFLHHCGLCSAACDMLDQMQSDREKPLPSTAMLTIFKKVLHLRRWLRASRSDLEAGRFITPGVAIAAFSRTNVETSAATPTPSSHTSISMQPHDLSSRTMTESGQGETSRFSVRDSPAHRDPEGAVPDVPVDFDDLIRFVVSRSLYLLRLRPAVHALPGTDLEPLLRHISAYIIEGTFASPIVVHEIKHIRSLRCYARTAGLQLLKAVAEADADATQAVLMRLGDGFKVPFAELEAAGISSTSPPIFLAEGPESTSRSSRATDSRWLCVSNSPFYGCTGGSHSSTAVLQNSVRAASAAVQHFGLWALMVSDDAESLSAIVHARNTLPNVQFAVLSLCALADCCRVSLQGGHVQSVCEAALEGVILPLHAEGRDLSHRGECAGEDLTPLPYEFLCCEMSYQHIAPAILLAASTAIIRKLLSTLLSGASTCKPGAIRALLTFIHKVDMDAVELDRVCETAFGSKLLPLLLDRLSAVALETHLHSESPNMCWDADKSHLATFARLLYTQGGPRWLAAWASQIGPLLDSKPSIKVLSGILSILGGDIPCFVSGAGVHIAAQMTLDAVLDDMPDALFHRTAASILPREIHGYIVEAVNNGSLAVVYDGEVRAEAAASSFKDFASVDGRKTHLSAFRFIDPRIHQLAEGECELVLDKADGVLLAYGGLLPLLVQSLLPDHAATTMVAPITIRLQAINVLTLHAHLAEVRAACLTVYSQLQSLARTRCRAKDLRSFSVMRRQLFPALEWTALEKCVGRLKPETALLDAQVVAQRTEMAAKLADVGYPLPLCEKALELHGDDSDRALEWLLSPASQAFLKGGGLDDDGTSLTARGKLARYLAIHMGVSRIYCEKVLHACNDDMNRAMGWIIDDGHISDENSLALTPEHIHLAESSTEATKSYLDAIPTSTSLREEMMMRQPRPVATAERPLGSTGTQPLLYNYAKLGAVVDGGGPTCHLTKGDLVLLMQGESLQPAVVDEVVCRDLSDIVVWVLNKQGARIRTAGSKLYVIVDIAGFTEAGSANDVLAAVMHDFILQAARLLCVMLICATPISEVPLLLSSSGGFDSVYSLFTLVAATSRLGENEDSFETDRTVGQGHSSSVDINVCRTIKTMLRRLLHPVFKADYGPEVRATVSKDCAHNIVESTRQSEMKEAKVFDSLHPHPQGCAYTGSIIIPGAKALYTRFDTRSALGQNATLEVARSSDFRNALSMAHGTKAPWKPVVVLGDALYYRFSAHGEATRDRKSPWGYAALVSPMYGLNWVSEAQVSEFPSLEWACWLLSLITSRNSRSILSNSEEEHFEVSADIISALLGYLSTGCLPYKTHVVHLLTRLLRYMLQQTAVYADTHLGGFVALEAAVLERLERDQAAGVVFFPTELQHIFELCALARLCKRYERSYARRAFDPASDVKTTSYLLFKTTTLKEPIRKVLPPPVERLNAMDMATDVLETAVCLSSNLRLPDWLICAATARCGMKLEDKRLADCLIGNTGWTASADKELIAVAMKAASARSTSLLRLSPNDVTPGKLEEGTFPSLAGFSTDAMQYRFSMLQVFNERLAGCIQLLDLNALDNFHIATDLQQVGHMIFMDTKIVVLDSAMEATWEAGSSGMQCMLHNALAFQSLDAQIVDPMISNALFVQLFRGIGHKPGRSFRCRLDERQRLVHVQFWGEEGIDWGGLSRDALTRSVEDCFSSHLDLFTPCANSVRAGQTGDMADKFVPHPKYSSASPRIIAMYEFLGKLMGHSMRHKQYFPFLLPAGLWHYLVTGKLEMDDLLSIDSEAYKLIERLQTAPTASGTHDLHFVISAADGTEHELVHGGRDVRVIEENRAEYVALASTFKLHEYDRQMAAVREGFFSVIPARAVAICTADELEHLVCGDPHIDVEALRLHTEYQGYFRHDRTVKMFWDVMRALNDEERGRFLRFACGRGRLPRADCWDRPFRLTRKDGGDDQLPLSHSCFFHIELPAYSSQAIMKQRILAAINFGLDAFLIT